MIYNDTYQERLGYFGFYNTVSFVMLYMIHQCLKLINRRAVWFQLHCAANIIVAFYTYNDVLDCFNNPERSSEAISYYIAPCTTLMLHLYHVLFFKLRTDDWIHHIGSCFICTPMCLNYPKKGFAIYCFFCCGFPGAIDYMLLVLHKNDWCPKIVEKKINAYLNSYVRMPGGIIGCYLIYKDAYLMETTFLLYSNLSLSFLIFMNTCYYGKQAIENYGVWKVHRQNETFKKSF
jgi:hypothetical protein